MNRLGLIRATDDLDLLIAKEIDNQKLVKKAMEALPDQTIKELGDEDISEWLVVRVNDEITVDLMTEASGISYDEAESEIDWVPLGGVKIPFANKTLMLRFKQSARAKDVIDRRFLEDID